jgi:hypothetical protein
MKKLIDDYLTIQNPDFNYHQRLINSPYSLGELLEYFVYHSGHCPTIDEVVQFVKAFEC